MAYEKLTPTAQKNIDAVIKKSPFKNYASACPWPDKVRSQKQYQHTKSWHYINLSPLASKVTAASCPASGCLLSAIALMQKRLEKQPQKDWEALLFFSHFIADLHQPLHVSYAKDLGGNKVNLSKGKKATNLHKLWDGDLLPRKDIKKRSQEWQASISPRQANAWRQGSVLDWANESFELTQKIYRYLPVSGKITEKYTQHFVPEFETQAKKASVRLAYLLENIYG